MVRFLIYLTAYVSIYSLGGSTDDENNNGTDVDTDNNDDGTNGTDDGNDNSDDGTGDEEEPTTTMAPTVLPAVVEETYITSNAIDLSGQKTVSVRSFTDSAAGTLDNIADGISETYWMSNDSNDAVKRLEFHFEVIFIGSDEIKDDFSRIQSISTVCRFGNQTMLDATSTKTYV